MSETAETKAKSMTVPEAGRIYLQLGRSASYEAAKQGVIPTIKYGKRRIVPIAAMERLMENPGK